MDIIISNSSGKPIYEQVEDQIKAAILSGELSEGEQLPSIRGLANSLRVSAITTKRAYTDLEAAGFIETVQGKGSFVAGGNARPRYGAHERRAGGDVRTRSRITTQGALRSSERTEHGIIKRSPSPR